MATIFALILMVANATTEPTTQPAFPASWVGRWSGPATTTVAGGKSRSFQMEIGIAPTEAPDRYTWEIVYIEGAKRQVRPYELIVIDAAAGKYVVDEKSSIMIDSWFIDGGLHSQFYVGTSLVTTGLRMAGDRLLVEMITTDPAKAVISGGEHGVPIVTTNQVRSVQRAELKRVK